MVLVDQGAPEGVVVTASLTLLVPLDVADIEGVIDSLAGGAVAVGDRLNVALTALLSVAVVLKLVTTDTDAVVVEDTDMEPVPAELAVADACSADELGVARMPLALAVVDGVGVGSAHISAQGEPGSGTITVPAGQPSYPVQRPKSGPEVAAANPRSYELRAGSIAAGSRTAPSRHVVHTLGPPPRAHV